MDERRKDHPIRELLSHYDALYTARYGTRYPFNGGRDAKAMQGLREMYADDQIKALMDGYFAIEDDFIESTGHSLGAFRGCLPKVIQFLRGPKPKVRAVSKDVVEPMQAWLERKKAAGV